MKKGDWVKVMKTGLSNGAFLIESVNEDGYVVTQTEGTYVYRITVKKEEVVKL